jgi:hypothetical protein
MKPSRLFKKSFFLSVFILFVMLNGSELKIDEVKIVEARQGKHPLKRDSSYLRNNVRQSEAEPMTK